jgi:hypothetical protein
LLSLFSIAVRLAPLIVQRCSNTKSSSELNFIYFPKGLF